MRKLATLLLAVFCFYSCYGLFACRTSKKSRSRADSTITSSEQQTRTWRTQTMQEVTIEMDDLAFVQSGLSLPGIQGLNAEQPVGILGRLPARGGPVRVKIRQASWDAGEKSVIRTEEKRVSTSAMTIAKEPKGWSWQSIALVVTGVLVIATISIRTKRT